jgi:hypothetical protein
LLLCAATSGWSFVEDRPPGAEFHAETSQEQVAQEQRFQKSIGEVGIVEEDTEVPATVGGETSPEAADVVAQAHDPVAAETVRRAGAPRESRAFPWWGLAVLGVLGTGGVLGVRAWVARNVPEMPDLRKPR